MEIFDIIQSLEPGFIEAGKLAMKMREQAKITNKSQTGVKEIDIVTSADLAVQAFHRMLDTIWAVVGAANRYVDEQAPWALRKTDPPRMGSVLYVLAETIRHLAILTQPVMPDASARILEQLAVPEDARGFDRFGPAHALVSGTSLPPPKGVFPRHVDDAAPR